MVEFFLLSVEGADDESSDDDDDGSNFIPQWKRCAMRGLQTCTQRKIRSFQYFQLHRVFSLQARDFILNIVYIVNCTICICRQYRTLT